ncbi:small nuclear (LSM) RNA-binding protein, putative [Bodo saltans]|uniref:Small nuclear (LSM) RNA-binding protein, putative n=1 Tax=Bodo saltans TaxID=75058 RepID=A0A0S4IHV7_BODSA|nr:small nuclear (LSM) RNA-binding protein, putative [Bodo saltans]|eukprot:CUE69542.1 small nuclear (LSM) RNA-binding protein, putative [Bodo saltans]
MEDPFAFLDAAVEQRVVVTLVDGDSVNGRLISFDEKCNVALADAVRSAVEASPVVGLKIIRGEMISHIEVSA